MAAGRPDGDHPRASCHLASIAETLNCSNCYLFANKRASSGIRLKRNPQVHVDGFSLIRQTMALNSSLFVLFMKVTDFQLTQKVMHMA